MRYKSISYIVPVYKTPLDLLERCLDSIEANIRPTVSEYDDWFECIVAFDGPYKLPKNKEFKPRSSRFKFITYEHAGTFECRKNAIDDCNGDLIVNVDSDDTIAVNTTQVILDEMNKHNYDMSYIPAIEIPSGIMRDIPKTKKKYLKTFISGNMNWRNSICNLSIVSSELGKRLVEETPRLKDYIMTEDQLMTHFYLNKCKKFGLIKSPNPLYMHYYGTGVSTQYNKFQSYIRSQVSTTYENLKKFYTEEELAGYMKNEEIMILRYKEDTDE